MSKLNKIQLIVIFVLIVVLSTIIYFYVLQKNNATNRMVNNPIQEGEMQGGPGQGGQIPGENSEDVEATGVLQIEDTKTLSNETYSSSKSDESVILATNGGVLTLNQIIVSKQGDTTNTENSEFYGINAAILAKFNSTVNINESEINSNSKGSNAVFATGENAKIYVKDTIINTSSDSSRGLDATYGGYIEADNVTITTQGGSSATLATDRGEGTVIASNSKLSTNGSGSPVIYSTGDITLESSEGEASNSQMIVIEGKNSATVSNVTLNASGKGNRNDADNCGIMIYQSMSGDAGEGTGTLTATDSYLKIQSDSKYYSSAPFFFITNTTAIINLKNNTLEYGSNLLLKVAATNEWGNSGNNGGNVTLNASNQKLNGDIEVDNISSGEINLKDSSSLEGKINSSNSAKSLSLSLDKTSKLVLTGDAYVTSFTDEDTSYNNIDFNGYMIYVNGEAIK